MKFVLHDMEEEEKVFQLCHHSEKLTTLWVSSHFLLQQESLLH
jgi:hypothetical protein